MAPTFDKFYVWFFCWSFKLYLMTLSEERARKCLLKLIGLSKYLKAKLKLEIRLITVFKSQVFNYHSKPR